MKCERDHNQLSHVETKNVLTQRDSVIDDYKKNEIQLFDKLKEMQNENNKLMQQMIDQEKLVQKVIDQEIYINEMKEELLQKEEKLLRKEEKISAF